MGGWFGARGRMAAAMVCSAAGGALALLDEPEAALQVAGLRRLDAMATHYWAEVSASIEKIETMYEDESFQERRLAALVAAKVFYYLGELDDSMTYALYAEDLFDITVRSSFVETIVNKCVDKYIAVRASREGLLAGDAEGAELADGLVPLLESVVERMFERCFEEGQFHHAIGIALEACRLDKLDETLRRSPAGSRSALLKYTLRMSQSLVPNRSYRHRVFRVLIDVYGSLDQPEHGTICQCLMFLDDADAVAEVLAGLAREGDDAALVAYQIAFDLYETDLQSFMWRMHSALEASANKEGADDQFKARVAKLLRIVSGEVPVDLILRFLYSKNHADMQVVDLMKSSVDVMKLSMDRNNVCHGGVIMSNAMMHAGTTVDGFVRNNLDWLGRATNWAKFTAIAGLGVVYKGHVKEGMNLLKPYLPNGGVEPTKQYIEGGSLYALGLIYSNHKDATVKEYLLSALTLAAVGAPSAGNAMGISTTGDEVVRHGACLGLGLTMMGTADEDVFAALMNVLDPTNGPGAVSGEAAGIALGLVMIGRGPEVATMLLEQMPQIKLEKAIRGLSLGCALCMYGLEEGADGIVEQMTLDQDPIVRYGGMQAIAMAYHGTGSEKAIRKLLHFAVTDVNNDVRRAAVMCLGFVMYGAPDQCTRLVASLSESYNPHVRYGAAMAVGIANAGTGSMQAVLLLQPMRNDPVDFVRQGASIALAQILLQQEKVVSRQAAKAKDESPGPASGEEAAAPSTSSAKEGAKAGAGGKKAKGGSEGEDGEGSKDPMSSQLREKFMLSIRDKHEDTMTKFGSILASGILDAGGRNMTLCLKNRWGHSKMCGVVGLMCFTQFWYWYPMVHFISLAFTPTAIIGLNADLEMPDMELVSKAHPSEFAYVPPMKEAVLTKPKLAKEAKLSISQKKWREEEEKKKKAEAEKRDKEAAGGAAAGGAGEAMEVEGAAAEPKEEPKEEPLFEILRNPARVLPRQERYVHLQKEGRYRLVSNRASGIVMLRDLQPGETESLISPPDIHTSAIHSSKEDEAEPKCPAPFYVDDDDTQDATAA